MGDLVEDLLLLARLDQGRPLESSPVDLTALVLDAATAARAVEPDRPLRVEVGERPVVVTGDGNRLRQVVDNLLTNVREHTPPDAAVSVRLDAGPAMATLVVADEGPGWTRRPLDGSSTGSGRRIPPGGAPAWACRSSRK